MDLVSVQYHPRLVNYALDISEDFSVYILMEVSPFSSNIWPVKNGSKIYQKSPAIKQVNTCLRRADTAHLMAYSDSPVSFKD